MPDKSKNLADVQPLPEINISGMAEFWTRAQDKKPFVVRNFVSDWPLVEAGRRSGKDARAYLLHRAENRPFNAHLGDPKLEGYIHYDSDMRVNIRDIQAPLADIFAQIERTEDQEKPPLIYLSSVSIKNYFGKLREENTLDFERVVPLESIWLGTQTRVPAHNDFPDNLACVAVGRRRFTLFPPDQFRNLYLGPIDNSPAGRPISMVDFYAPDFERFPNYRAALDSAQSSTLESGDVIFIPSSWWHQVEGLDPFNVLVNYWWRETPAHWGAPENAVNHAIMAIRNLPAQEREYFKDLFDYYIFESDQNLIDHIPEPGRGILGEMTTENSSKIRAYLMRMLSNE